MALIALAAKAIASLSSLEPPSGHRLSGLKAGEDIFAGAACRIDDDGTVYLSSANAADANADVHGFAWRTVKQGGAITLGFHERMAYGDALTPGAALYLSADNAKKGRLDSAPGTGSPLPCAFVMDDGQRIYCLQNIGMSLAVFSSGEATTFFAAVPQAAEATIATANATDLATAEALANALKVTVNSLLAKLRTAGIITP